MKKIVRSIAVVALMFVAATGLAKEPKLSLTPNTEKSLNFEMESTSEKTFLSIVDTKGAVLYSENITVANIYSKSFNLESLPEGIYFLKVEDTMKETVFVFNVDDSEIVIAEKKEKVKPIFRQKDGRVYLNLLNLDTENVKLKVYDSNDRILFNETITDELNVEKVFNFENAFKDSYTVVVSDSNNIYYETVDVK